MEGGLNYPGITRAHFYDLLVEGKYKPPLSTALDGFIENLMTDMRSKGATLSDSDLYLACAQITNAVFMCILTPQLFDEKHGLNLRDPETRRQYVNRLVDGILK
jgi:hypothetical protein